MATPSSFWFRVDQGDGCWIWTGATQAPGYGRLTYQGHVVYAHRLAYELTYGPIPEGLQVCHRCDNPPCVRPEHLFLGTLTDNLRDASRKGRMHPGSRHGMAKLSEDDVAEIRFFAAIGWSRKQMAQEWGVALSTIDNIVKWRTWRHVQ